MSSSSVSMHALQGEAEAQADISEPSDVEGRSQTDDADSLAGRSQNDDSTDFSEQCLSFSYPVRTPTPSTASDEEFGNVDPRFALSVSSCAPHAEIHWGNLEMCMPTSIACWDNSMCDFSGMQPSCYESAGYDEIAVEQNQFDQRVSKVIASDFARTEEQVKADEQASEDDFQTNKKLNEDDTAEKEKTLKEKEKTWTELKDELVSLADDKKAAEKALANAETTLEDLKKMCIAGEETYEDSDDIPMESSLTQLAVLARSDEVGANRDAANKNLQSNCVKMPCSDPTSPPGEGIRGSRKPRPCHFLVEVSRLLDMPMQTTMLSGFLKIYRVRAFDDNGHELGKTRELAGIVERVNRGPEVDTETMRLGPEGVIQMRTDSPVIVLQVEYAGAYKRNFKIGRCHIARDDRRSSQVWRYQLSDRVGNGVGCGIELKVVEQDPENCIDRRIRSI